MQLLNLEHEYPGDHHETWRSMFDISFKGPLPKTVDSEEEPDFSIGDCVTNKYGNEATVIDIDQTALDGQGMLTVRFKDGSEDTLPITDSDLQFVEPNK